MATANIALTLVDGARQPVTDPNVLVTARDGSGRVPVGNFFPGPNIQFQVPLRDNLDDNYAILVSAKHHRDAGFFPVTPTLKKPSANLSLMMLRRDSVFQFTPADRIEHDAPEFFRIFSADDDFDPLATYRQMSTDPARQPALACMMNILSALPQIALPATDELDANPLNSIVQLRADKAPQQDRCFVWVRQGFKEQLEGAAKRGVVAPAPKGLHPGATGSFKERQFGEANVQFTIHDAADDCALVGGVPCFTLELDVDYFKDSAAHILLEVFPNMLKKLFAGKDESHVLTDPKTVYGLRWIASQGRTVKFEPPYVITA